MNEHRETKENRPQPSSGNLMVGLIVLVAGVAFLLHQLNIDFFPNWLFRWPMILIAIGLVIGVKSKFTNIGWLIMVCIGGFFLLEDVTFYGWHLRPYMWPVGIILIGLFLIFRGMVSPSTNASWSNRYSTSGASTGSTAEGTKGESAATGEDFIDAVNIFGGSKRKIYSKHFRGGQTTNFFGGTDIDLTQADVDGTAVIEVVQVFGGVKLIVPSNWFVKSDMVSIFGGVSDKRHAPATTGEPQRTIILTGVCIFGGVDIKSY